MRLTTQNHHQKRIESMSFNDNEINIEFQVYASLRILEKNLIPAVVTARLGLVPSESFHAGAPRGKSGVWPHGYWEYSSKGHVESRYLENHLDWLLSQTEPIREDVLQLRISGCLVDIFCFWQFGIDQTGLVLSSDILKRLAELGVDLGIDVYDSE